MYLINSYKFGGGAPPPIDPDFTMLVKTDNAGTSASDQFLIKTIGGGYNYDVDWGDANTDTGLTGDITHTYASAGTYTVKISGLFPRLYAYGATDTTKILDILNWGNIVWGNSLEWMFYNADSLTTLSATDTPDFSNTTILSKFFRASNNFVGGGNIENWDVSNIVNFSFVFEATKFNSDISGWDTSIATNFQSMFFSNQQFNQDISGWDVQNVTNMIQMLFSSSSFNQNLGNWEIASLTSAVQIFYSSGMSTANYTDSIVGWANYVFTNGFHLV
jgi:surface protein